MKILAVSPLKLGQLLVMCGVSCLDFVIRFGTQLPLGYGKLVETSGQLTDAEDTPSYKNPWRELSEMLHKQNT